MNSEKVTEVTKTNRECNNNEDEDEEVPFSNSHFFDWIENIWYYILWLYHLSLGFELVSG